MLIYLPFFVCILGWCMAFLVDATKHPIVVETGKVMFWTGLLATLLTYRAFPVLGITSLR